MNISFPYEHEGKSRFGDIYRPIAKVNLQSPIANIFINIWMVVDTGADYTIIPRHFAEKLRISLEKDCYKDTTFGVGGSQTIYFSKKLVQAKLNSFERKIPLAFFDNNEVPALLGRLGFLETFDVEFLKNHTTVFKN